MPDKIEWVQSQILENEDLIEKINKSSHIKLC